MEIVGFVVASGALITAVAVVALLASRPLAPEPGDIPDDQRRAGRAADPNGRDAARGAMGTTSWMRPSGGGA